MYTGGQYFIFERQFPLVRHAGKPPDPVQTRIILVLLIVCNTYWMTVQKTPKKDPRYPQPARRPKSWFGTRHRLRLFIIRVILY